MTEIFINIVHWQTFTASGSNLVNGVRYMAGISEPCAQVVLGTASVLPHIKMSTLGHTGVFFSLPDTACFTICTALRLSSTVTPSFDAVKEGACV